MKKIIELIIIFLLCLTITCIAYFTKTSCIFYELTNLYCPGCGITRMFLAIFNLEFYQAFRYNPLVFCYLILGIIYLIICIIKKKIIKIPRNILILLVVITLLFWLLRNISYFSWLAPTNI